MAKSRCLQWQALSLIFTMIVLSACGQTTDAAPTVTLTNPPTNPPTDTATPAPTDTPTPTPIPGIQVFPSSSLGNSIPWLPLDEDSIPMSVYYGFNVKKPPFDNVLVRQAFAAAVDKELIVQEATRFKFRNAAPATSLTPPQVLGRDLYGDVGILFDPARAKELLQQAGYSDMAGFPPVTLFVSTRGEAAPGAYFRMAQSIAEMWETHLGVKVEIEVFGNMGTYLNQLRNDPPDIYQLGWGADYNDPDNFLKTLFHTNSEFNFGHFNNSDFDLLVDKASNISDPTARQLFYIQAEEILTEQEVGIIPLYHALFYIQP